MSNESVQEDVVQPEPDEAHTEGEPQGDEAPADEASADASAEATAEDEAERGEEAPRQDDGDAESTTSTEGELAEEASLKGEEQMFGELTEDEPQQEDDEADVLFVDDDDDDVEVVEPSEVEQLRAEMESLQAEGETLRAELKEVKGRLLRKAADLENFRKRTAKEQENQRKYGNDKVISDFLPIVDNLERALAHSEKSGDSDSSGLVEGVTMVLKQFRSAMLRHGVKGFDSLHEEFDPERHEAVQQVDSEEHETGTVIEVFQRGYHIHDRLLRPALVVVARNSNDS